MICGVVLSGGESKRFRELLPNVIDKALYVYKDKSLLQRSIEVLEKISDQLIVSCGTAEKMYIYRELIGDKAELVEDPPDIKGPLAGIYASLKKCSGKLVLILPVDMSLVAESLLWELVFRARDGFLASVIVPNSNLYPALMAMPRESGLRVVDALLVAGRRRLTDFHRGYPDLYYVNLARREDWRSAALVFNKPNPVIDEEAFKGHLVGDVALRRINNQDELEEFMSGRVKESLWYTLTTGDATAEFKLYSSHGLFVLAAKALLDSRNLYERILGEIILKNIVRRDK